ncbi:uncharacterized protein METZ01_LOCUS429158, partial [marine metagenome]
MKVLILGAAGFVGSNLTNKFLNYGHDVVALDGLLDQTGGSIKNLHDVIDHVDFIDKRIEDVKNLPLLIRSVDIVIDCMGWTLHYEAILDPLYDFELNVKSHLVLLQAVADNPSQKFIYLGSRVQYGNPKNGVITEETSMKPEDIQAIHKITGDYYYSFFSKLKNMDTVSLRFPNCYGKNQPIFREETGLISSFIIEALKDKEIIIYGNGRKRNIIFVDDLAEIIVRISKKDFKRFNVFNVSGNSILIH